MCGRITKALKREEAHIVNQIDDINKQMDANDERWIDLCRQRNCLSVKLRNVKKKMKVFLEENHVPSHLK